MTSSLPCPHGEEEGHIITGLTSHDVEGLKVVADHTEEVLNAMPIAIARALEEVGIVAEGYAKKDYPVDTGRLRNSITHTIDEGNEKAVIGTNVEYGVFVHEGTRGRHGRPFLRNAAQNHKDRYSAIFKF